jgi:F-box domain
MTVSLALLPPEILDEVLVSLDPLDVAYFAQTCKKYHNLVYRSEDNYLWRALYLVQPFDDPRCSLTPSLELIPPESIDWKGSLQAVIRARTVLADPSKCRPGEREVILRTLTQILRNAAPASSFSEKTRSKNLVWLVTMLRDGVFLTDGLPGSTGAELQLRAYLLVHLGLTPSDATSANKASARAFVYNMRNYRYDSSFGPYLPDGNGRINWVHVYAIHRTIAMHLVDLREGDSFAFPLIPVSMPYCQSIIPRGLDLSKVEDWAGIEGLWHCTFSFMDHRELLRKFNLCLGISAVQT